MREDSQVTYSVILTRLKQMEKVQIKTLEILHRIEKLLDIEEDRNDNDEVVNRPPFYYHPDER